MRDLLLDVLGPILIILGLAISGACLIPNTENTHHCEEVK
jgi:hypothetical protein